MRLTLIGHASVLIETASCRILMDPVLWDPHQEGLFEVHPPRDVVHEELPPFDVLVISHRHLDHFDVRSLAHLPRNVQTIIPEDALIEQTLRRLGYAEIATLAPFTELTLGATRVLTTPSRAAVREFGLVVRDATGACFNAVDTQLDDTLAAAIREASGHIDVLLATWQPMLEVEFQWNMPLVFPHARYAELLRHAATLAPGTVVPAANGFRYCGASAWLNHVVFPVSRARFAADAARANPRGRVLELDPGDVLELEHGACRLIPEGAPFVRRRGPGLGLEFRPVDFDARLSEPPSTPDQAATLRASVENALEGELARFLLAAGEAAWVEHRRRQIVQQIEVVFSEQRSTWFIDFSSNPLSVVRGEHPLPAVHVLISASALHGIAARTRTWDHAIMGGFYRRFQLSEGASSLADPLRLCFPSEPLQHGVVAAELERWAGAQPLSRAGDAAARLRLHPSARQP